MGCVLKHWEILHFPPKSAEISPQGQKSFISRKNPAVPNVSISSSFPKTYEQNEWIIHLAGKLLAQEEEILSLLATNPFEGRDPPR